VRATALAAYYPRMKLLVVRGDTYTITVRGRSSLKLAGDSLYKFGFRLGQDKWTRVGLMYEARLAPTRTGPRLAMHAA
jgi:hypothetical protein